MVEEVGLSAEANPPEVSQFLDMLGPITNRSKRHLKDGIALNASIKVVYNTKYIVVGELDTIHVHSFLCA